MTKLSRKAHIEIEALNRKLGALKLTSGSNNLGTHDDHEPPSPESEYVTAPGSPIHTGNFDEDNREPEISSTDSIPAPETFILTPPRSHSTPRGPSRSNISGSSSSVALSSPPTTPTRKRPSLTPGLGPNQCLGMVRGGATRCRRTCSSSEYCFQHIGQSEDKAGDFQLPSGVNLRSLIPDLLPNYLSVGTRRNLIECIKSPLSGKEKSGLIYAFKILDLDDSGETYIKVGRSQNAVNRKQEWENNCGFRLEELGRWPNDPAQPSKKAKYSHVLENLILLEVSEVARRQLHLLPGYPDNIDAPPLSEGTDLRHRYHCGTCSGLVPINALKVPHSPTS
ncbi:hypothetical protein RhiJN_18285 [Ceratobasidium sp. AG-Ba]|nr:hypothetical protein RhiJN_18285 [Ceratobasidium sp. AG-Ba]